MSGYAQKAAFFDAQARSEWADKVYGPEEQDKLTRLLALLEITPGQAVLEPGCGTGRLTAVLGRAVAPGGSVSALDISPRMVEVARERCAGLDAVAVIQGDLESCSLPEAGFDAVACHQVFPHFNDPMRAALCLAKLLKPGGRMVISHFIGRSGVNDVHRKAGTVVEQDMLPDESAMRVLLERAGFNVESLEDALDRYYLSARRRDS